MCSPHCKDFQNSYAKCLILCYSKPLYAVLSTTIVNVSLTACTDKEEEDITTIGGKSFKRIAVHPRSNITPGVRCSKRRRIVPIQPGQYLEYKIHNGKTPSKSYGQCISCCVIMLCDHVV